MKTILHIIDTTGPGGAETVFIDLVTYLPVQRYRSVVVIRGKGWVYEELCRRGIEPVLLEAKGSFNWRYLKSLIALIRSEKVDLIQSHLLGSNVYCCLAGMLTRTPVVATFHGMVDVSERERLSSLKFAAINFGASAIIAVSNDLRDDIVNRTQLRANKTKVIYNGINTKAFTHAKSARIRQQFGWSEKDVIIGCLGNIRAAKAYDVLLEASALLKAAGHDYKFVIAGQGSGALYHKILKLKTELLLDENVFFMGFNDNPSEFLSNLDVFLLSSSSEGFSISTIQAMATGLPVVATRSGGPQEIITHELNGYLVAPQNSQEMADGIEKIVSDESLRQRLAEAGRQHCVETFGIESMIAAYEETYQLYLR